MARTFSEIESELMALPEKQRAALAGKLLESLEGEADPGISAAWDEEIERRVAAVDSGQMETYSWEEVRAEMSGNDGPAA